MEGFSGSGGVGGAGFSGRLGVIEMIENTKNIQRVIAKGFNQDEAKAELDSQDFISMQQDGIMKALLGLTTIEEVERVTEGSITLAEEND